MSFIFVISVTIYLADGADLVLYELQFNSDFFVTICPVDGADLVYNSSGILVSTCLVSGVDSLSQFNSAVIFVTSWLEDGADSSLRALDSAVISVTLWQVGGAISTVVCLSHGLNIKVLLLSVKL